jgi:hypothetical protein
MSTLSGGPNIITDGLVLYLDAGNTLSYTSGSTIWNDLSRSMLSGSLINGPTFATGSIVFDGTNDYVALGTTTAIKPSRPTVSIWVKPGPLTDRFVFDGHYFDGGNGYLLYVNNTNQFQFWVRNSYNNTQGDGVRTVTSTTTYNNSTWYNVVGVYNGTNAIIYVNGFAQNSGSLSSITYSPNSTAGIANYMTNLNIGAIFSGSVAIAQVYNRALTASEVLQNYNATKGRFGL